MGAEESMMKSSGDILRSGGHIFYTKRRGSGSGRILLSYEGPGGEVKVPEGVVWIGEEAFAKGSGASTGRLSSAAGSGTSPFPIRSYASENLLLPKHL